ncbi:MAG: hypothetical protein O2816_11880, partial [Planctomycetota bacterium]|nr:hypothetical protein [Planctomycetota bacterium]
MAPAGCRCSRTRRSYVDAPAESGWAREERLRFDEDELVNTVERSDAMTKSGLTYLKEHPGWFARSRVKKLADLVTPLSFFTRHHALGHYDETAIGGPFVRKWTSLWAVACPMLALLLGAAGLFSLRDRRGQLLLGMVIGYTLATSMLVAMSRFRVGIEPLLIVCAAVLLANTARERRPVAAASTLATWGALLFLWWLNWPEVWTVFREMVCR